MRILFCGGGTGGHITPALAIAEEFVKKNKNCEVAFVSRKNGNENKLITDKKHRLYEIDIQGFSRSFSLKNFKTVIRFFKAKREAYSIIKDFKPDAVIGTGGYVSAPVICAAKKLNTVTAIHESNAALGLTAKLLSGKCDFLFLGSDIATKYKNSVYTGNPVSDRFGRLSKEEARLKLGIPLSERVILSVGGSIGAGMLNDVIVEFIKSYAKDAPRLRLIHITGKRYYNTLKENEPDIFKLGDKIQILPFIYDMPTYLSSSDIVITRCGAMTLAEIQKTGTPMIMIPSPNVTGNHQLKNAQYYKSIGAGLLLEESGLNCENLKNAVNSIINGKYTHQIPREKSKELQTEDPKTKIVRLITEKIISR